MDYSQKRSIRFTAIFDTESGEPLQVKWNRRIRNSLYGFIPKSTGFSQSNWGFRQVMIPHTIKPNISRWWFVEIVKGHWKSVIFTESNGYFVLFEIWNFLSKHNFCLSCDIVFYSPSPEYPLACCRDEWHGDPPKLEERRRVGFGEFRFDTP